MPRFISRFTLRRLQYWVSVFGVDPLRLIRSIRGAVPFVRDYMQFRRAIAAGDDKWSLSLSAPCPSDRYQKSGTASGQYFHQDLLVAQRIFEARPARHVDVGSRVDGFVAHVASFREIEVLDIRLPPLPVRNIQFRQCDVMDSDRVPRDYADSVSCLHALEHFGLGRYGDPIDPLGYVRGFEALTMLVKPGGTLYLSVPIGKECVEFNGQRIFSVSRVLRLAERSFRLLRFSYVNDDGALTENVAEDVMRSVTDHVSYGCGIFEFQKLGGK